MSELKPCPFCGGGAAYTQILGNYERPHEVYCSTCDGGITEGRSKDGVIHNWNTRPIEDALNKRIAELEAEVAALNGVIDRTVNAWESRCIEQDAEIAKLNGWVDELIKAGEGASWMKPAWFNAWDTLVIRINKERETSNELQSDAVVDSKECEDNSRAYDENHPAHKALVRAWKQKEREGNGN